MKNIHKAILSTASVIFFVLPASAQSSEIRAYENREQARTLILSYPSAEEAAAATGLPDQRSAYIRPLKTPEPLKGMSVHEFIYDFIVPFSWIDREIAVYVGGASCGYEVYVNDTYAGFTSHGSVPFEFDITTLAKEGANTLRIKAKPDNIFDRQETGRITGEVLVHSQPKIRVRDFSLNTLFNDDNSTAAVELGVRLKTHLLNDKEVRLYYSLISPDGTEAASGREDISLGMKSEITVPILMTIPYPSPWSHETPNLYTLNLKLQHEGRFTEYLSYRVGIKQAGIRDGKFTINGFPLEVHAVEYAASANLQTTEKELRALKAEGYNTVIAKGGPQPRYFYDLCDVIGLYVADAAAINTSSYGDSRAKGGNPSNDPQFEPLFQDRALSAYYSSRNSACTAMFSIAQESSNGYNLYTTYLALKQIEKQKPIIYPDAGDEWNSDIISAQSASYAGSEAALRFVMNYTPDPSSANAALYEITGQNDGTYRITNTSSVTALQGSITFPTGRKAKKTSVADIPVSLLPKQSFTFEPPAHKSGKAKYEISFTATGAK